MKQSGRRCLERREEEKERSRGEGGEGREKELELLLIILIKKSYIHVSPTNTVAPVKGVLKRNSGETLLDSHMESASVWMRCRLSPG